MDSTSQVNVSGDSSCTTIVGDGALDLYTVGFGSALKDAASSAQSVVVDLRSVTYIDTAIIANIAGAATTMLKRDKRLRVLLSDGTHPLRTLKMTGLSEIMDLVVDDAEGRS